MVEQANNQGMTLLGGLQVLPLAPTAPPGRQPQVGDLMKPGLCGSPRVSVIVDVMAQRNAATGQICAVLVWRVLNGMPLTVNGNPLTVTLN